jgi:protein SSD1
MCRNRLLTLLMIGYTIIMSDSPSKAKLATPEKPANSTIRGGSPAGRSRGGGPQRGKGAGGTPRKGQQTGSPNTTAAAANASGVAQSIHAPSASTGGTDSQLTDQYDQMQNQVQPQMRAGGHSISQSFQSRQGMLPSLGEDTVSTDLPSQRESLSARQGGPRFAGNAAFQSAIARHAAANNASSTPNQHQRHLSLQERFAEMGYSSGPQQGDSGMEETDDSGLADYIGGRNFDPTRGYPSQRQGMGIGGVGFDPHRRTESDLSSLGLRTGGHGQTPSMSGNIYAENLALQQQIELLQLQQQQLLQQQIQLNPANALGGLPQSGRIQAQGQMGVNRSGSSHRRIQSHAPQSGPMGSFSTANMLSSAPQQQASPAQQLPRAHGRRHSVNAVNRNAGDANPSQDFVFPPDNSMQQSQAPPGLARSGHFSHPSVQLSSLSPEYLMAGGGLVNLSAMTLGSLGDLADGFGGGGGGPGANMRGSHGRTGSQQWRINGQPPAVQQMTDLAQAQAHLLSLNQFRAQAGATGGGMIGHGKTPSMGGGFPMPGNFGQQQGGGAVQRKALFGSYLPQASLPPLLAAGKIVVGVLRVNKRNRSDAYVATEVLEADIFISGSKDRNRALDGDVVAVELLDPTEVWSIKKEKEDKKKRKEEQGPQMMSLSNRKPDKAKDDLEVEGSQLKLIEDEDENEDGPPALAGHVVAIIERVPSKLFSGTIGLLRPSSAATKEKQQAERAVREGGDYHDIRDQQRPKIIWFRPSDKRCPLVAIPADQAPNEFWDDQDAYKDRLFLCSIKRWPLTSLHPFGTLVEELGVIGNKDALSAAISKECLSLDEVFGENALKCLPPLPWSIPEREYETRRDFRGTRVFSIDPPTAKDLDDALSITKLDGGLYEIGVHIADVSYFVKLGSALDREARKRGTSVYMVERMIPMLPPTLSEELCSLVPGKERLTYSAVFTMNKDARVIGTWLGRTIIKSASQLAYSDAQKVIDGEHLDQAKILSTDSVSDVEDDITILHELASKMRNRRFDNGALKIDNTKLSFHLDESGLPSDASSYEQTEANQLIEEFMLLANMTVAQRIAAGLPDAALLRRHDRPLDRRLQGFQKRAKSMGYEVDISSSGALFASLSAIKDKKAKTTLEALATKSMLRAKYFCTGMVDISKYSHFALNAPLYTHFTSPIRRYADVMVHRQLDTVLAGSDKFPVDREGMAKIAQQCNVKRDAAELAQEQSAHLYLCLLVHDLTVRYGPVVRQATIMGVLDAAFDVIVHEFGIEKRVHVDQIPVEHTSYDERDNVLSLWWKKGKDTIEWLSETNDDTHLQAIRGLAQQHAQQVESRLSSQSQDAEAALFEEDDGIQEARRKVWSGEDAQGSAQRLKSFKKEDISNQGANVTTAGHCVQEIRELQTLPVVITADMEKAPPVLKVFAVNPWGP